MKLFKILLFWIVIISLITITHADYKEIVITVLKDIQTTNANKTDLQKKQTFENYIPKIKKLTAIDQKVKDALITYLNAKIEELEQTEQEMTHTSNITNIDQQLVEQTWLDRHNEARNDLWLAEYTIEKQLNNSAQNRSNHLAELNYSTHKRLSTDGYYNYESIKDRFSNQGITFPKEQNGVANFSENIAYQYLSCKKDDCTTEVLAALKKCFAFFMSEQKAKWPHYKAVVSPYFTQIWYGIAKVWTKIFIVTHYSVDF